MEGGEEGEVEGGEEEGDEEEELQPSDVDEQPDMWEESFKGHHDSKPYGEWCLVPTHFSPVRKVSFRRSQLCQYGHLLPRSGACVWHP